MTEQFSGREQPDQTYPAETAAGHAPVPPTEDPGSKIANTPETAETYAGDLKHRIEDRPDMGHRTGGRDIDPTASLRPDVEAPLAGGNEPPPTELNAGEQEEPRRELPAVGQQPFGGAGAIREPGAPGYQDHGTARTGDETSVRNEKRVVADSQAEFPAAERQFEWRSGPAVPSDGSAKVYATPQEAPADRKVHGSRKALVVTAMAAGIGLVALARMRRRR